MEFEEKVLGEKFHIVLLGNHPLLFPLLDIPVSLVNPPVIITLVENANLLGVLKNIKGSKKNYILFNRYMRKRGRAPDMHPCLYLNRSRNLYFRVHKEFVLYTRQAGMKTE